MDYISPLWLSALQLLTVCIELHKLDSYSPGMPKINNYSLKSNEIFVLSIHIDFSLQLILMDIKLIIEV